MNPIIQEYTVDFASNNNFLFVKGVQGDGHSVRYADISLMNDGQPYEMNSDEVTVVIKGSKPDSSAIFNECQIINNNTIRVEITQQMAAVAGKSDYEISVLSNKENRLLTSFPFFIVISQSSFDIGYVTSSNEFGFLVKKINEVNILRDENEEIRDRMQEAVDDCEDATAASIVATNNSISQTEICKNATDEMEKLNKNVSDAEAIRISNEEKRIENENARSASEAIRISNEEERVENENARSNAEAIRVSNESERVENENARSDAETVRISNEEERVENENTRKSNEEERIENENLRISAESDRNDNEEERISNENLRISAESDRKDNEEERISNENLRISAELSREAEESTRVENESYRQETFSQIESSVNTALANVENATNSANDASDYAESVALDLEQKRDDGYFNGRDAVVTAISGVFVFQIKNDDLYLLYNEDDETPDFHINDDGYLIWNT